MGRRVCFVVSDLLGTVTNSGIATATSFGALVLAGAGFDVTLVNTCHSLPSPPWDRRYRTAGVNVESIPLSDVAPRYLGPSYRAYDYLKDRDFDAIVFQDWLALGWASMVAKHGGTAFGRTQMVHICHGPDAWLHEANGQVAVDVEALALAHMGRVSAELCDTVVGPSRYLLAWMASAGWQLPHRRFVVPYFTDGHVDAFAGLRPWDRPPSAPPAPLEEIAFFGRLERRKGVQVFTSALNLVDPDLLDGIRISFLGRQATYTTNQVLAMLDGPVRRAAASIDFYTSLDQDGACAHLSRPGTVAVIASLTDNSPNTIYECIERSIPFLATTTGGTPELLAEEDRERCLAEPNPVAMAAALERLLVSGRTPEPAGAAFDGRESLRLWEEILDWSPPPRISVQEAPPVTAVITHHDRPALLVSALEAVDGQDYANLDIVVVDDGSELRESHRLLDEMERGSWRHELRILRQDNRFLGAARNAGARAARSDLVAFVDDDDVPVPHFVSSLVTAHQATDSDAVTCAMRAFHKPLGTPAPADDRGTWVFLGDALHLAAVENCLGGAPVLLKRSALEAVGGYHERHGLGFEDWHLYVRLLFAGYKVMSLPEPLYWYRIQPISMRSTMSAYDSALIVLEEFRKAVPPAIRGLVDLARGQNELIGQRSDDMTDALRLRERLLWITEERLHRALAAAAGSPPPVEEDGDGEGDQDGNGMAAERSARSVVSAGADQVIRALSAARSRARRSR